MALERVGAVQPGQGLHGGQSTSSLSTYMVVSSGWSKPVWYFSATTRMRYSGWGRAAGSGHPPGCSRIVPAAPVRGSR